MDACLVGPDYMLNNKCYLITGDHLVYILSYLNSKLFTKIMLQQANVTGGKGEGFLSAISLIPPTDEIESKITKAYNNLYNDPVSSSMALDEIFCDLYGLTLEEKSFILDA